MSSKTLKLFIGANISALNRGLKFARKSVATLVSSIGGIAKKITAPFRGMSGAIMAAFSFVAIKKFLSDSLSAFVVQEKAVNDLKSVFTSFGEDAEYGVKKIKKYASELQKLTGIGDEVTIAMAGQLKMLGVTNDKLIEAIDTVAALRSVNVDGATAIRAVANAMQGEYSMLNRYIPAIKNASTEEEKVNALREFTTVGLETLKSNLDTTGGAWEKFKSYVGDAKEGIGKLIVKLLDLPTLLNHATTKVQELGDKLNTFADSKKIKELADRIKSMATIVISGDFDKTITLFKLIGDVVKDIFKNGARVFVETLEANKGRINRIFRGIRLSMLGIKQRSDGIMPPNTLFEDTAIGRLNAFLESLKSEPQQNNDPEPQQNNDPASELVNNSDEVAKRLEQDSKQMQKSLLEQELSRLEKLKSAIDKIKPTRIKNLQKQIKEAKRISDMLVKDIIAEDKKAAEVEKEFADEDARADKIKNKIASRGLGFKASKADIEFLEAWKKREASGNNLPNLERSLEDIQSDQLTELKGLNTKMEEVKNALWRTD